MRRLRRREIIQGVALASPDYRESIVVEYMQNKKRERQTLAVSHDDGSDNCDRGRTVRSHCGSTLARQVY